MTRQKRGFWLFIFSLIPGAGEMYMGFKKQGISIMILFWAIIAVAAGTNLGYLLMFLPILWFYSFFNVHNLKSLSEEEFYSIEDSFILHLDDLIYDKSGFIKKYRYFIAILLILCGISMLGNIINNMLYLILPSFIMDILNRFTYSLPQLVIAIAIIMLGIYMITGKRKQLFSEEDKDIWGRNEAKQDSHSSGQNTQGSPEEENTLSSVCLTLEDSTDRKES